MQKHMLTLNLHKFTHIFQSHLKCKEHTSKNQPKLPQKQPTRLLKETQVFNHKETPNDHHL